MKEYIMERIQEAVVGLAKCKEAKKEYGIRFEKVNNVWNMTWAFPIKKAGAGKREGYDENKMTGAVRETAEYPGCPYCGTKHIVICGCGGIYCNEQREDGSTECPWCGLKGTISAYDGHGFGGKNDR